ncbi:MULTISPECIES: hypothetical protein [Streptomyces]|nr:MULTISPECIES: hypothetical protein [unclassified Streptomyces]
MNAFDQMAAAQHPLGVAMQIADVTLDLREALAEEYDGDVQEAAADSDLRRRWAEAEPETRACLLLSFAWHSREHDVTVTDDHGGAYAEDLHQYAAAFEGGSEAFHGPRFPSMPLPGQAGALASSVAFDRDDCDTSLKTVLLLMAPVCHGPRAEPVGLDVLSEDVRASLPAGTTAARCSGCGEIRISRPDVPLDEWKNHWPDECEAFQADGGR